MRPSNLRFSIIDPATGQMAWHIKNAFVATRILSSVRLDYIIEGDTLYEVFYERLHLIEWDALWNWVAIISFQIHRKDDGTKAYYAIARPYSQVKRIH